MPIRPVPVSGHGSRLGRAILHAGTALALVLALAAPAAAQAVAKPGAKPAHGKAGNTSHMVLVSDLVTYNNDTSTVIASGHVRVYYDGKVLTSDKLTYLRASKRLIAEGGARLVNNDGTVVTGSAIDVTEQFHDAFVRDLHIASIERSHFSAASAKRSGGNVTEFENASYNACQTCGKDPARPPFWEIKAAKIIHNQQEKMVYYEDASLVLMGRPIAWVPYFSTPDPTVKRKSGFLVPNVILSGTLGTGARVPYFWAPKPDWDVTLSPTLLSRQGLLMDVAVRHRTETGLWSLQGVGINQMTPSAFESTNSQGEWRGAVFTKGDFQINQNWSWGWDAAFLSDRRFSADYKYKTGDENEATSTLFLTGVGKRNYFDARVYSFQVYTDDDTTRPNGTGKFLQDKQPFAATVDYNYVHDKPVFGGELSGNFNLTVLDRIKTDLDLAKQLRGLGGSYTRASAEVAWRRQMIDRVGQIWKPFLSLRGDALIGSNSDKDTVSWISDGAVTRLTPTAGFEYRYPFLFTSSFGNHILEPIAQLAARTSETRIGNIRNEDAQSLVFDDTTLFQTDKFSGWDRVEGGVRANIGLQYTFLAENGASISAMAGRSYHLAGTNSYATPEEAQLLVAPYMDARPLTGIGSGLDTRQSDYVGRILIDTAGGLRFGTQARFGSKDFNLQRLDTQATFATGPLSTSITYAYLQTPDVIYTLLTDAGVSSDYFPSHVRQELQTAASLRLTENWRVYGSMRYDVVNRFLVGNSLGIGYDNDSFSTSLSYIDTVENVTSLDDAATTNVRDRTIYLRIGLRTLGDTSVSNKLSSSSDNN